jgi:hypothetical protein
VRETLRYPWLLPLYGLSSADANPRAVVLAGSPIGCTTNCDMQPPRATTAPAVAGAVGPVIGGGQPPIFPRTKAAASSWYLSR